ncbi:hypothetical protein [Bradyrhizobium sp. Gha]|uniref:hypothetical protein n=1 Tax=Bradyrhizobium sp. Gha TaxID=1855318 RepID=UPI0008F2C59B|nr:hypothetical protein [Bradyrhizobium sp. Gha]SFJ21897.1 hypothetical protein SAMN05216525_120115 [Bradyrhizobium sp. Gha]
MRKLILVAAMVLVSGSAQAGGPRSLSLAAASDQAQAPQAAAAPTFTAMQVSEVAPAAVPPVYVDRPSVSTTAPSAPAATTTPASAPVAAQPAPKTNAKADRPRHNQGWSEGRIISELHRHGIYW